MVVSATAGSAVSASFLMTDIEGSTSLWDRFPAEMVGALEVHDRIVRGAIEAHSGNVFSNAGDSFAAAFPTAADAIRAAHDIQHGIEGARWPPSTPLRVRIGVHAGEAVARDGNYFGPDVNRAARIMSIGDGGTILVSDTSIALIDPDELAAASVVQMGSRSLRGFTDPVGVFELRFDDVDADRGRAPDDGPIDVARTLNAFVGRDDELRACAEHLSAHRLVTIVGAGGCGKTRLASEVAWSVRERFPGGVHRVALAGRDGRSNVAAAVAEDLSLVTRGAEEAEAVVHRHLADRSVLLLIDNCEHVLDDAASFVHRLLERCPETRVVSTSRQRLRVRGEVVVELAPLSTRAGDGRPSDAARLLLDRAGIDETGETPDRELIDEVCRQLDGLPLALELAAAALRTTSIATLYASLRDRFVVLVDGERSDTRHHETLWQTFAWGWELLDETERRLLAASSVFAGDFTVESLAETADVPISRVLAAERRLVEKSFVIFDGPRARYRLLTTIREFAAAMLHESNDGDAVRRRFGEHLAAEFEGASPGLRSDDQREWLHRFRAAHDDLAPAVLALAGHVDRHEACLRLLTAALPYWKLTGRAEFGVDLAKRVLPTVAGAEPESLARAYTAAGDAAAAQASYDEARELLDVARLHAARTADPAVSAALLAKIGVVVHKEGRIADCIELLEHAVERARAAGDPQLLLEIGAPTVIVLHDTSQRTLADELLTELLEIADGRSETYGALDVYMSGAELALNDGDLDLAESFCARALAVGGDVGEIRGWALGYRGESLRRRGRYGEAVASLTDALAEVRRVGHRVGRCWVSHRLSAAHRDAGDLHAARQFARMALEEAAEISLPELLAVIDEIAALAAVEQDSALAEQLRLGTDAIRRSIGLSGVAVGEAVPDERADAPVPEELVSLAARVVGSAVRYAELPGGWSFTSTT